jgi:hypothetical protein
MTPYRLPKSIQLQRLCNINIDYSTVMAHCRRAVGALFTKIALVVANLLRYSGMGNDPPNRVSQEDAVITNQELTFTIWVQVIPKRCSLMMQGTSTEDSWQ